MKPEYIDAIHALARDDIAVHAFMRLKYQQHMQWDNVLAQMVLHLAGEKAAISKKLMDIYSNGLPPIFIEGIATKQAEGANQGDEGEKNG